MSYTVQQIEKQMDVVTTSDARMCLSYPGANIIYLSLAAYSEDMDVIALGPDYDDFSLSAEDYPVLARIWDNDSDSIFDEL